MILRVVFALTLLLSGTANAYSVGGAQNNKPSNYPHARDVVDTFGVCTHYERTSAENKENVLPMLRYLGIRNVRFDVSESTVASAKWIYDRSGVKSNGLFAYISSREQYNGRRDAVLANIEAFDSVEGLNEFNISSNSFDGLGQYDTPRVFQQQIYDDFKQHVDVYSGSMVVKTTTSAQPAEIDLYKPLVSDYLSTHVYPIRINRSVYSAAEEWAALDDLLYDAEKGAVITEIGAHTVTSTGDRNNSTQFGKCAATEEVQAKHNTTALMHGVLKGYRKTFLYELVDGSAETTWTDGEAHFGQFLYNGTPKASATAIQNLVRIIDDVGIGTQEYLDYSVDNTTIKHVVIQKQDGSHIIAMWQDAKVWDCSASLAEAVVNQDIGVNITFDKAKRVKVYDPIQQREPISTTLGTNHTISVPDYPVLVKVEKL